MAELVKSIYGDAERIINDRLSIETKNTTLCSRFGKNELSIPNSGLMKLKTSPLYILVPNTSKNEGNGSWVHDMVNFKIYMIERKDVPTLDIDNMIFSERTRIEINESFLVYDSSRGDVKEITSNHSLTTRERVCIDLRIPESGTEWIDGLIRKSNLLHMVK